MTALETAEYSSRNPAHPGPIGEVIAAIALAPHVESGYLTRQLDFEFVSIRIAVRSALEEAVYDRTR